MTDHNTDEELMAAARGAQAEMELRETEKAFESLRLGLFETIAGSGMEQSVLREKCYLAVFILDGVKQLLLTTAASKAVADHAGLIRGILSGEVE
jgi:hypothetical protein